MAGQLEQMGAQRARGAGEREGLGAPPALELRRISKIFGANRALDGVDLRIDQGEVVALVGQNGSGKSTLVKVLSGFHEPEPGGQLFVGGEEIPLPVELGKAAEIGLAFVYQNLALSAGLSVLENLNLGRRIRRGLGSWSPIHWRRERQEAAAVLERYHVDLELSRKAGDLAPVDQARLAIVRAAEELRRYRERTGSSHSILVLDEPTVFLPEEDIEFLFALVRTVVSQGAAVLFISHDLAAIREIADRIVVLRDGKKVAEAQAGEVDEDALVELIVGVSSPSVKAAWEHDHRPSRAGAEAFEPARAGKAAVSIEHLAGGRLRDLSLAIGVGEIVGLAGLIGSGAEDVPYLVFGATRATSGRIRIGDAERRVAHLSPEWSVRHGVALVPADRGVQGLSAPLTVWENMTMLVEDEHFRQGLFHRRELIAIAEDAVREFDVRPPRVDVAAGTLSGGNQQKVVLAKWLLAKPRLLVLHEPTQGVDIGARRDIYRFVKAAASREGMAVLWVTTEFGELAEVCDRVLVVSQGRELSSLGKDELTEDAINAAVLRQFEEVR
jgi:ribose transport system ATP-binding protein